MIIVLGDVLHTMNILNTTCLNIAIEFFKKLDETGIKTMILVGNHDYIGPNEYLSTNHWMNVVSTFYPKNITIVDKVIVYKNYLFMPYVPIGRFKEALNDIVLNDIQYIFCHQEFKGVEYEFGNIKSEQGDEWDKNIYIISGHIHKRQWLGKYIYYTGTPYQTRFNEDVNKTIAIVNTGTQIITEINFKLPQMITIYKNIQNVDSINTNEFLHDNLYKIIITVDTMPQIQSFLKTNTYKLLKKYAVVIFSYSNVAIEQYISTSSEPPNFKQMLFDKVQQNENMLTLFKKVIGE